MLDFFQQVLVSLKSTTPLEAVAVVAGIVSVYFSRKENTWVYPTGLVNTIAYIYISLKGELVGEASVNFYYTVMSIYGWWLWTRKDRINKPLVKIAFSNRLQLVKQFIFFLFFFVSIFFIETYLKQKQIFDKPIPWADAFASASAYTGMWLMARKKVESWGWWMATNIASIPLYYVKGYALTSVYYFVLLGMAVAGLIEWRRKAKQRFSTNQVELEQV